MTADDNNTITPGALIVTMSSSGMNPGVLQSVLPVVFLITQNTRGTMSSKDSSSKCAAVPSQWRGYGTYCNAKTMPHTEH